MPIKIPKGFARRKSSGNALEEVKASQSESSFRVLERPRAGSKSFDGGSTLAVFGGGQVSAAPSRKPVKAVAGSSEEERANSNR
ncbi:MAG: hypothetical protein M1832_003296, partial [Thelocarpon impressellum]